ncbi:hypothetical protein L484_016551 [Morus notabilis]|uniref:Glycosyltransferase N-terminal domain-containing protein n=1 Tax=Morus notabilis TaxID=981085 RepID=W9QV36_9ROSA|nr:hypothetical protein L484_016551 [Morus notabilis]
METNPKKALKNSPSSSVVVVMVPFPVQSHLNQLLQLSHIISSYNIPVHYVGSSLNNSQVKSRASRALNDTKRSIHFHDFPIPHFPSPLPNETKFPSHLLPSFQAALNLRQPFANLLTLLSKTATRIVLIHDRLMASVVQDATSFPNTEAYVFHCVCRFQLCLAS